MKKAQFVNRARKGFTLLEALFAVLIIAILAAIAVPMYINTKAESEKKTCASNVRAIASAQAKFSFEKGAYCLEANKLNLASNTTTPGLIGGGLETWPACPTNGAAYVLSITNSGSGTGADCKIACTTTTHATKVLQAPVQ